MMLLKAAQHLFSLQHDHILCSRPCRDPANGADIADRFVRQHGDQIRRVFFSRFFTSEQKPFAFSLREKSTADCITAHADIDLLACVDKTFDCFHFQSSEKIIPYSEHEKTPIVRRALRTIIHTHHSSITTLPFGRLVCGQRACLSRTLYRLVSV